MMTAEIASSTDRPHQRAQAAVSEFRLYVSAQVSSKAEYVSVETGAGRNGSATHSLCKKSETCIILKQPLKEVFSVILGRRYNERMDLQRHGCEEKKKIEKIINL